MATKQQRRTAERKARQAAAVRMLKPAVIGRFGGEPYAVPFARCPSKVKQALIETYEKYKDAPHRLRRVIRDGA